MQSYQRGILDHFFTHGDTLVRKIDLWWPAITPRSLAVVGGRGYGNRSLESQVVSTIGSHFPWLRQLALTSAHRIAFVSEYAVEHPFDGTLFLTLANPGILPRLRSLHVTVTRVDAPALRAFADSDMASRLHTFDVEVGVSEADHNDRITVNETQDSDAVRLAIEAFLARHS